ncbi:protein CLT1, chloroplastic-like [Juglans microcarpa x Juglans regia]|uniref:protein CLT1, chloroplastic-like n=1 Tax=Juglans microcarpa x Juglans regia TaxID=2249226 RepID=UPI001B7F002A|nr:protein CLT1, chloroplastic-like [Juglans microcarpa x Juglans regia]
MASFCRRITAGAVVSDRTIRLRQSSRTAEILRLPRNYLNQQRPGIVLRSGLLVVEAVGSGGGWERSEGGGREEKSVARRSYSLAEKTGSEDRTVEAEESTSRDRTVKIAVAAAVTVVMGVGNRVMYKLALVPLKHYPFFLAQLATFGYVVVYFSILYLRYHAGIVTDEMLSMRKGPFLAVGLLEALGAATGMAAGAILSGASIPILSQTFLVWQILLSVIFLGRRYRANQLLGCFLVALGVIITVASGSSAGQSLKEAGIFWNLLMIVSFLFQAADTVLKEVIFLDAARDLKGGSVDLFVINSYGSAFQAFFIFLLLPFLSKLWGIPFSQLPNYLKDGAACFLNIGTLSSGCEGAPLLPLLFVAVNMGFNISLLYLLKISSAVVSCLASTFSVPIAVYVFTLPLPYLGVGSSLPAGFVAGAIILIMGLLTYAWTPSVSTSE